MHDAPIHARILKMHKPPLACGCIHQRALMRTVHGGVPLVQNHFVLVRAKYVARTQHRLPSLCYPAGRSENVVPTVAFEKLWAFDGVLARRLMKHDAALVQQPRPVRRHGADAQAMLNASSRTGIRMDEVSPSVVVPERARINQTFTRLH